MLTYASLIAFPQFHFLPTYRKTAQDIKPVKLDWNAAHPDSEATSLALYLTDDPDPSMQQFQLFNVAVQHGISHTSVGRGRQSSDLRHRSPRRFVTHHWGFCVQASTGDVRRLMVCECVCSHTDWQECLKCCQQLNLQLRRGTVWVSVPRGKMDRAYYRWGILHFMRF